MRHADLVAEEPKSKPKDAVQDKIAAAASRMARGVEKLKSQRLAEKQRQAADAQAAEEAKKRGPARKEDDPREWVNKLDIGSLAKAAQQLQQAVQGPNGTTKDVNKAAGEKEEVAPPRPKPLGLLQPAAAPEASNLTASKPPPPAANVSSPANVSSDSSSAAATNASTAPDAQKKFSVPEKFKARMAARTAEMHQAMDEYTSKLEAEEQKKDEARRNSQEFKQMKANQKAEAAKEAAARAVARQKVVEYRAAQEARRKAAAASKQAGMRIAMKANFTNLAQTSTTNTTEPAPKAVGLAKRATLVAPAAVPVHSLLVADPRAAAAAKDEAPAAENKKDEEKEEEKKVDRFDGKTWANPGNTKENWLHGPKVSDDRDFVKDSNFVKPDIPPRREEPVHSSASAGVGAPLLLAPLSLVAVLLQPSC